MEEARLEIRRWSSEAIRLEAAFKSADTELREAIVRRDGAAVRYTVFDYYDARLAAGHAWYPFKTKLADAMRWHKACLDEATAINKELGK